MSNRALIVSTVPATIGQFNNDNINILQSLGYDVHVASNFADQSVWSISQTKKFMELMADNKVACHQIDFNRNISCLKDNYNAYLQIRKLLKKNDYKIIHTHTPIASAIVRYAARKKNLSLIYTAHGFHFYKGAPLKNWIVFYPVEKALSRYTDILITINQEDYDRAKKKFDAKKTVCVPGVGVDFERFKFDYDARIKTRAEMQLSDDEVMIFSVGELNTNKNHSTIIRALGKMDFVNVHYYIAGEGALKEELIQLAKQKNVNLQLLGFRSDIPALLSAADLYILPSIREGLNVSLIEAIAASLPCLVSDIRGNADLIINDENRIRATDIDTWANRIKTIISRGSLNRVHYNNEIVPKLDKTYIHDVMLNIYSMDS